MERRSINRRVLNNMTNSDKKEDCLVIANNEIEVTEAKAEKAEEKVDEAHVTVMDVHIEAAEVHKEAAEVHLEAAAAHIEAAEESKEYLVKKITSVDEEMAI